MYAFKPSQLNRDMMKNTFCDNRRSGVPGWRLGRKLVGGSFILMSSSISSRGVVFVCYVTEHAKKGMIADRGMVKGCFFILFLEANHCLVNIPLRYARTSKNLCTSLEKSPM